jgi:hypothetical protein
MIPAGLQNTIGHRTLHLNDEETIERALTCVHDQRIKGLPFETSQFSDIAEYCTTRSK